MVTGGFDVDIFADERVGGPVNGWVEGLEPGVSQDDSVTSNVGDEEAQFDGLGSPFYPEVGILLYGACVVF